MRKIGIAAVVAASLAAVAPASASAATYVGPCETQRELFEKYNIELNMHQEQVEWAYTQVCAVTG